MKDILVFAHMMKTAGTSLSKQLIAHFGNQMHIVPGGLKMHDHDYDRYSFEKDLKKFNYKLRLISGHPMRPYIDFGKNEKHMTWFTFLRKPAERYVSHYLHDYKWTNGFSYPHHRNMENTSIIEWEKLEDYSNYQTKFIAGEDNFDKAVEQLETKIKWVGLTEEYEKSLNSFTAFFELNNFYFEVEKTNASLARKEKKRQIHENFRDFIKEKNNTDIRLYNYVKDNIWPGFYSNDKQKSDDRNKKNVIKRRINTLLFHFNRQFKFNTTHLNYKNIKRFYNRWYR